MRDEFGAERDKLLADEVLALLELEKLREAGVFLSGAEDVIDFRAARGGNIYGLSFYFWYFCHLPFRFLPPEMRCARWRRCRRTRTSPGAPDGRPVPDKWKADRPDLAVTKKLM